MYKETTYNEIMVYTDERAEEFYKIYEPYFDEALKFVDSRNRAEVMPRRIFVTERYMSVDITTRTEFTSYKFNVIDGKLEYVGMEGDFRD